MVTATILASLATIIAGLFLALFKRGRRRFGLLILGLGFAVMLLFSGSFLDQQARANGWDSYADKTAAESQGFTTPAEWQPIKAARDAERQAMLDAARKAAEARRAEEETRQAAEQAERDRQAEETAAQERAERAAEQARAAQDEAARRRAGFHCLSSWDGAHSDFKRAAKAQMRNPASFEHIETRITPVDQDGRHVAIMTYRAENGFGGMTIGTARASIKSSDCSFAILSLE